MGPADGAWRSAVLAMNNLLWSLEPQEWLIKAFKRTCGYDSLVSHSALFAEQLTGTFEVLVLLIVVVSYDDFYSMKK